MCVEACDHVYGAQGSVLNAEEALLIYKLICHFCLMDMTINKIAKVPNMSNEKPARGPIWTMPLSHLLPLNLVNRNVSFGHFLF